MFGVYFGKYLESKGLLTKEQLQELLDDSSNTKVKMGLLAVESGYMTTAQADEVNMIQQMQDKRFGDIAIEKGYLSQEQVDELLEGQGDGYLLFIQALIEHNVLTLGNIQAELNAYKKAEHYTARDIDAIKSGDVDRIVPIFMKDDTIPEMVKEYIALTARNIVRFIDRNFRMEKVEEVTEYTTDFVASQAISGDHKMFTGFCGNGDGIRMIAEDFAKEHFEIVDLDVLDAACEFLNCNNGLYATNACDLGVEIDMEPPVMKTDLTTISAESTFYRVPLYIKNVAVDLIICLDEEVSLA